MRRGIDTTFLVEVEVRDHPHHEASRKHLDEILDANDTLLLAPQALLEFIHVVTDVRRFERPLSIERAVERAEEWWGAQEVAHAFPSAESVALTLEWLRVHKLGRKRLLDTQLAATYHAHGARSILSSNARDFAIFGCFDTNG